MATRESDIKHKTAYPNVRYKTRGKKRENGSYPDRAFYIRYRVDGKEREELVGRASKGMTALKANQIVSQLLTNIANGKRPCTYKEWKELAQKKREAELEAESIAQKQSIPFGTFFENEYYPAIKLRKAKGSLEAEEALYKKWIAPTIRSFPLNCITYSHLEEIFRNMQNSGMALSSVKYAFAVISQVWSYGKLKGICEGESPTRHFHFKKLDNKRERFLTPTEAALLINKLGEHSLDLKDMAIMALYAGLRAGEIFKLKWIDVNFTDSTIFINHPKSGYSRYAYFNEKIKTVLENRYRQGVNSGDYIFPATNGEKRNRISNVFDKCVEELGLNVGVTDRKQKVVFHTLRHTFASRLVQKAKPITHVQALMGHSEIRMTQRYAHLASEDLRNAAQSLDD